MIQHKKRKNNGPFIITVVLLLLLIFFSYRNPEKSKLPSNVLNTIVSPINKAVYSFSNSTKKVYDQVFGSKSTRDKVQDLEAENRELEDQIRKLKLVIGNKEALVREYDLVSRSGVPMLEATVSSVDPSSISKRFLIDKGKKEGVKQGDLVVEGVTSDKTQAPVGLIGRVEEVGPHFSKVITIMDQKRNVSVISLDNHSVGIINGREGNKLLGYMMDVQSPLDKGEEFVTSGNGKVYPRGVLVGRVEELEVSEDELTKNFILEPAAHFNQLYRVLVIHREDIPGVIDYKGQKEAGNE